MFKLVSDYKPTGDQPQAIEKLEEKDLINLANGTLKIIFEKISNKNNIIQKEISEETGIPLRTVKRNIEVIKRKRILDY